MDIHHNTAKIMCPYGHTYSEDNTYVNPSGARVCKCCQRLRQRRYYQDDLERNRQRGRDNYRRRKQTVVDNEPTPEAA